jgi:hypothetical protein
MTTHQHDSSHPQQSHDSPQATGLGLMMVVMEEAALAGIVAAVLQMSGGCRLRSAGLGERQLGWIYETG